MKFRMLGPTEKDQFDADCMAILDYTDVAALGANTTGAALSVLPATTSGAMPAAGTSGTDTIPAGTRVALSAMKVITDFVSATASSLTIKVGDGGDTSRFLAATQIQSGQTPVEYATGVISKQPYMYVAADTVDAIFVSVAANLSTFTAGALALYFKCEDANVLPIS